MNEKLKNFSSKKCKPCEGGLEPFSVQQSQENISAFPDWVLSEDGKYIEVSYVMKDFLSAVEFINEVAKVAEEEDHHPDLYLTGYRNLKIILSTHAIGGLSENDFIVASKIEQLPKKLKSNT